MSLGKIPACARRVKLLEDERDVDFHYSVEELEFYHTICDKLIDLGRTFIANSEKYPTLDVGRSIAILDALHAQQGMVREAIALGKRGE